jgi:hypothetical protein
MMNAGKALVVSAALVLSLALAGCALDEGGREPVAEGASPLVTDNALIPNALIPNALIPNALIPNALIPNALIPNALDSGALAALQDPGAAGALSRQLMRYVASCALDATQSFDFSWTDESGSHNESYPGVLGIAPGWATGALTDDTSQRLVSGCLAGRANWYGVTVVISMRSKFDPLKSAVGDLELLAYPNIEGAFWGNLFAPAPYMNACYKTANVAIARADLRDCAAGHLDGSGNVLPCGPIAIAGHCSAFCDPLNGAKQYYPACVDHPGAGSATTTAVITTALP